MLASILPSANSDFLKHLKITIVFGVLDFKYWHYFQSIKRIIKKLPTLIFNSFVGFWQSSSK